jgi:CBS domain-containing protein
MKIGVKVGDIMTENFVSISPDENLKYAAQKMIKKRVGSLVVLQESELKGIITERDIIWAMVKKNKSELEKIRVKDICKKKVHTIKPSSDLYIALVKMKNTKYRWLPVISRKKVIGLLTIKDILRVEPSLFETAQEIMQIKHEAEELKNTNRKTNSRIIEGICEECGNTEILYKTDGRFICSDCREQL